MLNFLYPDTLLPKIVMFLMIFVLFPFFLLQSFKLKKSIQNRTGEIDLSEFEFEIESNLDRLKTLASSFIIMGLLGTFFGIAESFAQLSSIANIPGKISPTVTLSTSIQQLLIHLRSSFAPSIWGIMLTLISIYFLNSLYGKYSKTRLEISRTSKPEEKINQAVKTLDESIKTLEKILDDVKSATTENYETLKNSMSELVKNIHEFNEQLKPSSEQLKNFNEIVKNQNELANSINKTSEKFEQLSNSLNDINLKWDETLNKWENISQIAEEKYEKLNEPLEKILHQINDMSSTLNNLKEELKETMDKLNEEIKKLPDKIEDVRTTILNSFGRLEPPLKESAEKIDKSFNNFITFATEKFGAKITETITDIKAIANEFKKYQPIDNKIVDELNNNIRDLNQNMQKMITTLSAKTDKKFISIFKKLISKRTDEKENRI
jgi:methyl-accepting chemotaxis protein